MAKKAGVPLANAALRHTLAARDRANKFSEKGGLISPTIAERQIPLSPPSIRQPDKGCLFLYFGTYAWQRKRACPSLMPPCGIRSLHAIGRTSFRKRRLFSPTIAERQIPLSPLHHRVVKAVLFCWRERRKEPSLIINISAAVKL